jgi:predicted site-specific integrase-resolvase
MAVYKSIKQMSEETGISETTLRNWCRCGKIRFNIAGKRKYILRSDWLEVDLERMAAAPLIENNQIGTNYGKLRIIQA